MMQGEMHLVRELAKQVECIWECSPDAAATATSTALAMVAGAFSISGDIARASLSLRRAAEYPPPSDREGGTPWRRDPRPKSALSPRYSGGPLHFFFLRAAGSLGSPTILAFALAISAQIGWWSGQWSPAYADATDLVQWATENGQPRVTCLLAERAFGHRSSTG